MDLSGKLYYSDATQKICSNRCYVLSVDVEVRRKTSADGKGRNPMKVFCTQAIFGSQSHSKVNTFRDKECISMLRLIVLEVLTRQSTKGPSMMNKEKLDQIGSADIWLLSYRASGQGSGLFRVHESLTFSCRTINRSDLQETMTFGTLRLSMSLFVVHCRPESSSRIATVVMQNYPDIP